MQQLPGLSVANTENHVLPVKAGLIVCFVARVCLSDPNPWQVSSSINQCKGSLAVSVHYDKMGCPDADQPSRYSPRHVNVAEIVELIL